MSKEEYAEARKLEAQRVGMQMGAMEDRTFDSMLNNLFVDDSYVKAILRGDVQEPLNNLTELIETCKTVQRIDVEHYDAICCWLKQINEKLVRYQRLTPYVFLLSQLMSLTNITEKEAEMLKHRVSIMIRRDILDIQEEDLNMEDVNFYDGLKILIFTKINDSREGWKARLLTQPKKEIAYRWEDNSPSNRKKKFGIF